MHNLISFFWLLGIGYLVGFFRGQKSTCQPMTFVTQLAIVLVVLLLLTVVFKTTFGVHFLYMR